LKQLLNIRGSSSAFVVDGLVISQWGTGCYRKQLIASYGLTPPFPPEMAKVGAMNERVYELGLIEQGVDYLREVEVFQEVMGDITFSGHIDFWCPQDKYKIRELKSATSEKTFIEVIRRGHYKSENLAQVVAYMVSEEVYDSILSYTYYSKEQEQYEPTAMRNFQVRIRDDGRIMVDEEESKFTVDNYLQHRYNSAKWLVSSDVPPRPKDHDNKWKSCCKYCEYASACNMYDCNFIHSKEEFINEVEKGAKK
jgi:hypothetical protein